MKALNILHTQNGNTYLFDRVHKQIIYLHPFILLLNQLYEKTGKTDLKTIKNHLAEDKDISEQEIKYYLKKFLYLKKKYSENTIDDYGINNIFPKYTGLTIKKHLTNIQEIVFEVTEKCNLNCYYCINGKLYNNKPKVKQILNFDTAKVALDYFIKLWNSRNNNEGAHNVTIGFYGGELDNSKNKFIINFKL